MLLSRELLQTVADIAVCAGREIIEVYQRPGALAVSHKADDSPVTEADMRAHKIISERLSTLTPLLPILSEESALMSFEERSQWSEYWLVDPLDGTKEFISRNGEFTVNIALIREGEPVLGVVHVPVTGVSYLGCCEEGGEKAAWIVAGDGAWQTIAVRALPPPARWHQSQLKVVASRRHGGDRLQLMLAGWKEVFAELQLLNIGSSLKICLIAEGRADIYPRLAPTSEWDTAAAHAVLKAAGGDIVDLSMIPLCYNQKESMLNPDFIALTQVPQSFKELLCAKDSIQR